MSHQIIGIILLIAAVSVGLYASTHYMQLTSFKVPLPSILHPVSSYSDALIRTVPSRQSVDLSLSSSYSQKPVAISYITLASTYPQYTQLVLTSNLGAAQVIDITGWTVRSRSGKYFAIPKAQEIYSFGGPLTDIILKSGDRVNLYSSTGDKGNFRMNKCMGYLQDQTPFTPSIPLTCPTVSRSETTDFSSQCQDYVSSLRACQNPSANPPIPIDDSDCHEYLRKFNYVGCVDRYGRDSDFLSSEWWAWPGDQMDIFDPVHDKIQLINTAGKVVDEYTY